MKSAKVLLRRSEDGQFQQVGRISERRGKVLTLSLEDGTIKEHQLEGGEITPVEGSFIHLVRLAPQVVETALADAPERIFKQLLSDSAKPMTARQMKDKLSGFPGPLVDKAWLKAKAAFDADDDVEKRGASQNSYALRKAESVDLLDLIPRPDRQPHVASVPPTIDEVAPPGERHRESAPAPPVVRSSKDAEGQASSEPAAALTAQGPAAALADDEQGSEDAPDNLASRLTARFPDLVLSSPTDVTRQPLAVAGRLRSISKSERQELASGLSSPEARLLEVLSPNKVQQDLDDSTQRTLRVVLTAASHELKRHSGDKKARAAFVDLLQVAAAARAAEPSAVIRGAKFLADVPASSAEVERCLVVLADLARSAENNDLLKWDLAGLARAARAVALDRDGGRSRLIASLHARIPQETRQARWWDSTAVSELAEAARGRLGAVLDDDTVARSIVAPKVERLVAETGSRSGVALLWGLPRPLARHVDAHRMTRLLADVARDDELAEAWVRALSNADMVAKLRQRVSDLDREVADSREREVTAQGKVDRLSAEVRRVADQLAAARNAEVSDRGSRDRQVRLDLLRSFAIAVAQVKQSEAARNDGALMRQIDHACRREGLQPLGEPGQHVLYDAEKHETLTPTLSTGSAAIVVRGGYTWADGDEFVVLVKSQVVAN
jgi:hypothetical protein